MSATSWLMWLLQASSASSHTAGWKAARMAEKKGDGGGEARHSSSSSLSSSARLGGRKRSSQVRVTRGRSAGGWLDGRLPGHAAVHVELPSAGGVKQVGRQRVAAVKLWRQLADGERDVILQDASVSVLLGRLALGK